MTRPNPAVASVPSPQSSAGRWIADGELAGPKASRVPISAESQRDASRGLAHHPQPGIWVAEWLQNGGLAEGRAEEIPGNQW